MQITFSLMKTKTHSFLLLCMVEGITMAAKLPLSDVLGAIDRRDFNWYGNLDAEKKKAWSSWLFIRYASSTKGKDRDDLLLNTNEFVNKHYGDIYKHEELVWKLMCLTGTGKKQYHEWIKAPNSKIKKDAISQFVSETYPTMNGIEVELFLKMNDVSDMKQMATDMGMSDKEVSEIFEKKKAKKKKSK
jgi:hypothetical protein